MVRLADEQPEEESLIVRLQLAIRGAVQGVGFRPFVFRLANEIGLKGFVSNTSAGALIEAEGLQEDLDIFIDAVKERKPAISYISSMESSYLDPVGYLGFEIRDSLAYEDQSAFIMPDLAVCPECLEELFDKSDRRYHYPFINCTNCGPRFSIIGKLPYDRQNTTMQSFAMCSTCLSEYENPADRRYHAQPNTCPDCGPHLELWDPSGIVMAKHHEAILTAADYIMQGKIVALKGIGGFQLICDATNESAIRILRERKKRDEKPFALIFPDIGSVKSVAEVSDLEERILLSAESPIVILKRKEIDSQGSSSPSELAAPGNPNLGIMLPYTPLHHLLMRELGGPVIATSGNLAEEPICIDEQEALQRLGGIADYFLVHNRPILRHVDDSIARVVAGRQVLLRRARGYAPLPLILKERFDEKQTIIAVGGFLKNTVALKKGNSIYISQHIGDLSTNESYEAFTRVVSDFSTLYGAKIPAYACDLHPDYPSTSFASSIVENVLKVQHHSAHIAACRLENEITGTALGVAFDGTGYGDDGTIWGGEFFISGDSSIDRIARLRQFSLPGGDSVAKEARRSALGILYEIYDDNLFSNINENDESIVGFTNASSSFSRNEFRVLRTMLRQRLNCPKTSSAGRLFDAVASIAGVSQISNFEGQSAMKLEFCANENEKGFYEFGLIDGKIIIADWEPVIRQILNDVQKNIDVSIIAARFHNSLSRLILNMAKKLEQNRIMLSGGCFQNKRLTEGTIELLESAGIKTYIHQRFPPNDGCISLGQVGVALLHEKSHDNK